MNALDKRLYWEDFTAGEATDFGETVVSAEDIIAFYRSELESGGFDIPTDYEDGANRYLVGTRDGGAVRVTISTETMAGGGTRISFLGQEPQ